MGDNPDAQKLAELAALVDSVKQRVRARYPETTSSDSYISVGLPDLQPLARARDAAAGKMASIGSVNPRRGGTVNNAIQAVKRTVARSLNWFVRDQVTFNRQIIDCIETSIETLADVNRTIHLLASQTNHHLDQLRAEAVPLREEAKELRQQTTALQDLGSHGNQWREQWQLKLHRNEVEFLRSVADLNIAFHQKVTHVEARASDAEQRIREMQRSHEAETKLLDEAYRKTARELEANCQRIAELIEARYAAKMAEMSGALQSFEQLANTNAAAIQRSATEQITALAEERVQWSRAMEQRLVDQSVAFEESLSRSIAALQTKFYADLDRIRTEYERIIHAELRVVRQRLGGFAPVPATPAPAEASVAMPFDYARFSARFRGSEEYVAASQQFYVPYFKGRRQVLDIGCGRGEFLTLMREAGVPARGIEASEESVAFCRNRGLDVEQADLFRYLENQPEGSLDGIFCSQVVEHIQPAMLPGLVRACASRLATGGVLAIETPNPECLAIFATHFYLDPTHTRPIPAQLLAFYMEEAGLGRVEIHPKAPAIESIPELGELNPGLREKLFGGLDYAILAYKL